MQRKAMQLLVMVALATFGSPAYAQGLTRVTGVLQNWKGELLTIIPIVAVLGILIAVIAWWMDFVRWHSFVKIAVGCLIIGSADMLVRSFLG